MMLRDMKAVEDVERLPRLLGDDLQVRLPHVAADELSVAVRSVAEPAEERSRVLARRCWPIHSKRLRAASIW